MAGRVGVWRVGHHRLEPYVWGIVRISAVLGEALILVCGLATAQVATHTLRLVDGEGAAIPYANVYIVARAIGTMADEAGFVDLAAKPFDAVQAEDSFELARSGIGIRLYPWENCGT